MKKKNQTVYDELNHTGYSAVQNIWYCLKNTAKFHFPLLIWCLIAILTGVALPVLSTYLPRTVIDKITTGSSLVELVTVILAFMGSIAILSGLNKFITKFIYHQKLRMNTFYQKHMAQKGLTTDYCNHEKEMFRKLQTESFSCCFGYTSPLVMIYNALIELVISILGLSVFGAMLIQLNWGIIFFLIVTTVISYFLNQKILYWINQNNPERISYMQRIEYLTEEDVRSAKDIRLYRMAIWFSDIYNNSMNGLTGWYKRLTSKLFGVSIYDGILALLRESIAYIYLLYLVWNHQLSVADFILYFSVIAGFSSWLGNIFSQMGVLNEINLKINYFRSYIEYPESYRRDDGLPVPTNIIPHVIELKNVSYRYDGSKQYTLRHFNLTIVPGEHVAVVGLNGAGKTTLVKLICGLIDPTEGQVLYNGIDIREYNRTEFYQHFSAVFQQFSLLPMTIEEIVSETLTENTDHTKVEYCLRIAGLWDKIEQLSDVAQSQFGRIIYDDGIQFSGGEVQKLLLARALYKSAPVLILDEPTAALDPIAESNMYQNYNSISAGKTTLFISHRLASTSFCDRIILIENGNICEEGTHTSLLAQKGTYYHLFEMQAKYYRENIETEEVSA